VKKDYIRALIHSRKMNTKTLEEAGFADVKIKYYTMLVEYYSQDRNAWEISQAYYKVRFFPFANSVCDDSKPFTLQFVLLDCQYRECGGGSSGGCRDGGKCADREC